MRRCIVHIGGRKTGSTALQRALRAARDGLLADHGIHVLSGKGNQSGLWWTLSEKQADNFVMGHRRLVDVRRAGRSGKEVLRVAYGEQIFEHSAPITILSGEAMMAVQDPEMPKRLHDFLAPMFDRIDVVGYVRPPVAWLQSRVQQEVKLGAPYSFLTPEIGQGLADMATPRRIMPTYRNWIEPYTAAFGADHLHVYDAQRSALIGGDIVEDFAQGVLGRSAAELGLVSDAVNESFSAEAVALMEWVNSQRVNGFEGPQDGPLRAFGLLEAMRPIGRGGRFPWDGIDGATVSAAYAEEMAWLHDRTEGRIDYRTPEPAVVAPTKPQIDDMDRAMALGLNDAIRETEVARAETAIARGWRMVTVDEAEEAGAVHPLILGLARLERPARSLQAARRLVEAGMGDLALSAIDLVLRKPLYAPVSSAQVSVARRLEAGVLNG